MRASLARIVKYNYAENKILAEMPWVENFIPGNGLLESWRTGNRRMELGEDTFPKEPIPIELIEKRFPVERGEIVSYRANGAFSTSTTITLVSKEGEVVAYLGGMIPNPEARPIPPKNLIERFLIWWLFGNEYPEYILKRENVQEVFLRIGREQSSRVAFVVKTGMKWYSSLPFGSANGKWIFHSHKLVIYKTPVGYKNFLEFVERNIAKTGESVERTC